MARSKKQTARKSTGGSLADHRVSQKQVGVNLNLSPPEAQGKHQKKFVDKNGKTKYRPGFLALKQIRHYQRGTKMLIKRAPFYRLVKQILREAKMNMLLQVAALEVLQVNYKAKYHPPGVLI